MTRRVYTAGQRVRLPGGGSATVIAPADAAGLVLVELRDRTLLPVPAEHLVDRCPDDEAFARAALAAQRGRDRNVLVMSGRERATHAPRGAGSRGDAPASLLPKDAPRPLTADLPPTATDGQGAPAPTPQEVQ